MLKKEVDKLVSYIIENNEDIKKLLYDYVEAKIDIKSFYSDKNLDKQEEQYRKEIYLKNRDKGYER